MTRAQHRCPYTLTCSVHGSAELCKINLLIYAHPLPGRRHPRGVFAILVSLYWMLIRHTSRSTTIFSNYYLFIIFFCFGHNANDSDSHQIQGYVLERQWNDNCNDEWEKNCCKFDDFFCRLPPVCVDCWLAFQKLKGENVCFEIKHVRCYWIEIVIEKMCVWKANFRQVA